VAVADFAESGVLDHSKNVVLAGAANLFSSKFEWRSVCIPSLRMAGAKHFRDLTCWQLADELKLGLYKLADSPSVRADVRFREQLIDAARSAPRNIAEGFGRRTHREFAMFLDIARGSLMECQNHLQDAVDRKYLARAEFTELDALARRTCGAVARLQQYLRGR
jgi:four helix bundle protein